MYELAQWLQEQDDLAIFGHRSPDGDACGSCIALALALNSIGKRVCVCLPEGVPGYLQFLPGLDFVVPDSNLPFAPRSGLSVDVSSPEMLGCNRALYEGLEFRAVLDHHESNPLFGQINHVEPDRAATGELALELIQMLGIDLTKEMADCLFSAISSDTGNFNYSNTSAATFEAAAECVRAGASVDSITRHIYRTRTFARTKLLGAALSLAVCENSVAYAGITNAMLAENGATRTDTESIINYLSEIEGVSIAVLATEQVDGMSTKVSLRSVAPYNVARDVAQPLGGGGHERAAGISIALPLEETLAKVLKQIEGIL